MWLRRIMMIVAMLTLACSAKGQNMSLYNNPKARVSLSFDFDRVWNYNLYERSRWGAGLELSIHDSVNIEGYVGYGVRDQQWKGGGGVSWTLPFGHRGGTVFLSGGREYYAAASRRIQHSNVFNITDISGLSSFMTQLMDDRTGISAGYLFRTRNATYIVEGRAFRYYRLYDRWLRPLYLVDGAELSRSDGYEVSLSMHRRSGFSSELLLAKDYEWRLLAQYDHRFGVGPFDLYAFAQAGICSRDASFFYQFDLGGTYGSPLWFRNSMLTLYPYEFVAQYFAFGSLRLQTHNPLFKWWNKTLAVGSNPRPMIGVNGAYGGKYNDNTYPEYTPFSDEMTMPAVEFMAGIDGLIRWGVADYGVAFAFRPWPLEEGKMRSVLLFTAALAM